MIRVLAVFALVVVVAADVPKERDEGKVVDESRTFLVKGLTGTWATREYHLAGGGALVPLAGWAYELVLWEDGRLAESVLTNKRVRGSFQAHLVKGTEGKIDIDYEDGTVAKGIFRLDNSDTLTLCLGSRGGNRPTKFDIKAGRLFVLNRQ